MPFKTTQFFTNFLELLLSSPLNLPLTLLSKHIAHHSALLGFKFVFVNFAIRFVVHLGV